MFFKRTLIYMSLLAPSFSLHAADWFMSTSPLNHAHQKLMDNDLSGSFAAITKVWQSDPEEYVEQHLNDLLLKSLESDCGKTISNEPIVSWIHNVVIKRQSIQSPGRIVFRTIVDVSSDQAIQSVNLTRWPEGEISTESAFEAVSGDARTTYRKSYELTQRTPKGLYRLEVTRDNSDVWSTWIILEDSKPKQVVRWDTQDTWAVDKIEALNPYCSLPILTASLYDYKEGEYVRVWNKQYEKIYPTQLPIDEVDPERYVLAVGIIQQRWQGPIVIEEQQVISKTYDISAE